MKTIDCFIPYSDEATAKENVAQFRASNQVNQIFLLAHDATLPQIEGCSVLFIDTLESSATLRQMALVAKADFVAIYSKYSPITVGYGAIDRVLTMETGHTGIVIAGGNAAKAAQIMPGGDCASYQATLPAGWDAMVAERGYSSISNHALAE